MMRSHVGLPKIVQGIHVVEKDSPVLKQRMKRGIKREIMEERGKCQPERREQYTCCLTLKQTQLSPSSHPVKTFPKKNPLCQQSRHKTETQREWEGRSE